jgi:hypothetical protein
MSDSAWLVRRHLVNVAAAAVVAFYLHCLSIIMSSQAPNTISGSQQWTDLKTEAFLQFLISHKSEIGEAGNFKKKTYTAAAGIIPGHTRTSSQVQTKWQGVSQSRNHFFDLSHIS